MGGFGQVRGNAAEIDDPEAAEDRLIESPPHFVAGVEVELVGVAQQFDPAADLGNTLGQVILDRTELLFDDPPLVFDLTDARAGLCRHHAAFGYQVDEVVSFRGELIQPDSELSAEFILEALLVGEGAVDGLLDPTDELVRESHGAVVLQHGFLNFVHRDVTRVTSALLASDAEEVVVLGAGASGGALDDEAAVAHASLQLAFAAKDTALQVALVEALPLTGPPGVFEHGLDAVEQLAIDEGRVASIVSLTLVGDLPQVVGIAEQPRHLRRRNWPGRAGYRRAGGEAAHAQLVNDLIHRVLAAGVERERQRNEGRALRIDDDGVDLASVKDLGCVEVAERCFAERATALRLLAHFVGDVGAVFPRAILVEGGEDAVHELAHGGVVDLLGGGDQGDAALLQLGHDQRIIDPVAGEAAELVNDDVVDVLLRTDALQHLLEGDALFHLGAAAPRLDVLVDDRKPQLIGLTPTGDALSGEGDAFRVVVGSHLVLR